MLHGHWNSKMKILTYPIGGAIERNVERPVRDLCNSRKIAKGLDGKRILLKGDIVEKLVENMIWAAAHAASGPIPNRVRGRGAPPDNARIILADGILRACKDVGIAPGLRYAAPRSFAVDLFNAIAPIIWPTGGLNPRKTFERLRRAKIVRN
jgi:hypothetical protein